MRLQTNVAAAACSRDGSTGVGTGVVTRPCRVRVGKVRTPSGALVGAWYHHSARVVSRGQVKTHFKADEKGENFAGSAPQTLARTVLIALDHSAESDLAVDWAAQHLVRQGDQFHLFHLSSDVSGDHSFSSPSGNLVRIINGTEDESKQQQQMADGALLAERLALQYAPRLERQGVPVSAHVVPMPHPITKATMGQALCDKAKELEAAVVVVASHSHGGLTELVKGSVANYAIKHCDRPVAVLHAPSGSRRKAQQSDAAGASTASTTINTTASTTTTTAARNLVVAVDAGPASVDACKWLVSNLYRSGDAVHLVHVVPSLPLSAFVPSELQLSPGGYGFETDPDIQKSQLTIADQEVQEWEDTHTLTFRAVMDQAGAQYQFHTIVLPTEDPVATIGSYISSIAEDLGAAAVVLNRHKHSPLFEFFIGSVSSQVAHHCSQPVLVLHDAAHRQKAGER